MEKELYFTPENIGDKAMQFLGELADWNKRELISFRKESSALLALDMQRIFFEPSSHAFIPSAAAIVPLVMSLALAYTAAGLPLYFSRHINTPSDAGSMGRWWRELIWEHDPGSELIDPMKRFPATVIVKSQYDAFHGTPLKNELIGRGVRQVVICGVMTHLCCETTARSAFINGFDVFFTVDGTATYTSDFHRASLRNLTHGFVVPVTTGDVLKYFGE